MKNVKTILVTGGAGYVGSGLVRDLLHNDYKVICVDTLSFGGESLLGIWGHKNFLFYCCDINDYSRLDKIMEAHKFDAVIHLAAIVGDPACEMQPDLALEVNWISTKRLLDRSIELGISRFIFSSTCSNYGKMENPKAYVTEKSPLNPVSLYAELKVRFENYILHEIKKTSEFCPVALRFSTVYGISPRMRFDLTVNEFTKEVALGRELIVFGEQFWRPYCHVRDFSRAFISVLQAQKDQVAYDVFNVGDTEENYTKKMLVDILEDKFPEAKIKFVEKNDDPRDYRVNSDKIKERLGFRISRTVPEGIQEIEEILKAGIIQNPEDQRYYNIPHSRP
ncbi:MAG: epimerase [Nitrosomonadaceae bacterium]|nr:epimerase [Nitrosomonadaceae bacterium]|tara:strand:+ start:10295 stop:11302 length:1008 start_codon:yes stop_codon:yes gene_type:complete